MINLLPDVSKAEIRAGRVNRLLLRYIVLFLILMVILFGELGFAYLSLSTSKSNADRKIADSQANSASILSKKQRVDTYSSDIATAKQILDKQVNYSSIILKVSSVIPSGVVLDQLTLDPTEFGQPLAITARAKDDAAALALKERMNSSPYFQDPHFETVTSSGGDYPISVSMTVTFTQELLK